MIGAAGAGAAGAGAAGAGADPPDSGFRAPTSLGT